jgi:hypothetical protein
VKTTSLLAPAAAVAVLAAAVFAATVGVQASQTAPQAQSSGDQAAPQGPPPQGAGQNSGTGGRPMRNYPAPTNLQVLPKDLTGRQVRDIMQKWAGSLGVNCEFCHVADLKNLGPNGRPRMRYADDSKPNKQIARIMVTMTDQINKDYINKAMDLDTDNMGSPITCGTCHRGHQMPEDFVIPREEQRPAPDAAPGGTPPGAPAATGAIPPTQ